MLGVEDHAQVPPEVQSKVIGEIEQAKQRSGMSIRQSLAVWAELGTACIHSRLLENFKFRSWGDIPNLDATIEPYRGQE